MKVPQIEMVPFGKGAEVARFLHLRGWMRRLSHGTLAEINTSIGI